MVFFIRSIRSDMTQTAFIKRFCDSKSGALDSVMPHHQLSVIPWLVAFSHQKEVVTPQLEKLHSANKFFVKMPGLILHPVEPEGVMPHQM
jgi:hypothetical protein